MDERSKAVPISTGATALELAERRRDHATDLDLGPVHEEHSEVPPAPRQGQRTARPGPGLQVGVCGLSKPGPRRAMPFGLRRPGPSRRLLCRRAYVEARRLEVT